MIQFFHILFFERKYLKLGEALDEALISIDNAYKKEGKISGVPTGLKDLDKKLGGLHNSDLIIIAGRPSMGKSALGTNIALMLLNYYKNQKMNLTMK